MRNLRDRIDRLEDENRELQDELRVRTAQREGELQRLYDDANERIDQSRCVFPKVALDTDLRVVFSHLEASGA